jgi:hypothetical protein
LYKGQEDQRQSILSCSHSIGVIPHSAFISSPLHRESGFSREQAIYFYPLLAVKAPEETELLPQYF